MGPVTPRALDGKVAVVTGAGAGIGKAIALLFAAEGAHVVVASRSPGDINQVVLAIRERGGHAVGVVTDVSVCAQVERMWQQAIALTGQVDILVNNAGIMDDFTPVADVSDDLWRRVLATNLDGTFYACRLAVPAMEKQGAGAIVNIASIAGHQGSRAGAAYTASKHAMIGLTKNIGYMYAKTGLRCNAIAPGGVATTIGQKMKPHPFGYERMAAGVGNNIRTAEPDEIARIALFLASDASSFINGAVLTADGGWTAY